MTEYDRIFDVVEFRLDESSKIQDYILSKHNDPMYISHKISLGKLFSRLETKHIEVNKNFNKMYENMMSYVNSRMKEMMQYLNTLEPEMNCGRICMEFLGCPIPEFSTSVNLEEAVPESTGSSNCNFEAIGLDLEATPENRTTAVVAVKNTSTTCLTDQNSAISSPRLPSPQKTSPRRPSPRLSSPKKTSSRLSSPWKSSSHLFSPWKSSPQKISVRQETSTSTGFSTNGDDDSDHSSEEESRAYYAGRSERGTGQQIICSPKKKKKGDADNFISQMLSAARQHGAEVVGPTGEGQQQCVVQGRTYRLGTAERVSETAAASVQQPTNGKINIILKLWRDGFSVDDGELRDYTDPQNTEFLDSIKRGEISRELIRQAQGGEVDLIMEDHSKHHYAKSEQPMKSVSGEGHGLGRKRDATVKPPPLPMFGGTNEQWREYFHVRNKEKKGRGAYCKRCARTGHVISNCREKL